MTDEGHKAILVRFEATDVAALLRSSLAPLIEQAKEQQIELRVETLGSVPPLSVDNEKLAWGVATLVGNALRYVRRGNATRAGGSVLVHIEHDEDAKEVAIAVQDDGPGIPKEKLPYLFERRSGAPHVEGLALSLVRDIVNAHGGRIEVESRTGTDEHGTSITIRIPLRR
ncbi:MAG: Sensory box histidine kinase [Labilithrix sp.]|jgi:signal transduction histidine kinase|nr:Sensory box histidine kinase [Labilithrix sp.]